MRGVVAHRASERSQKSSDISDNSSDISDAMRLVQFAAAPRRVDDTIKSAIDRAARTLGWSFTRTRDIWYGQAHRIDVREMDALRLLEQQWDHSAQIIERKKQVAQLAALRARLQINDPDFHDADIAAITWAIDATK